MKKTILLLLLLTSLTAFAHEDTYKAIEKSNVHIKIQVGYESSLELRIVESYAEIINDFIRKIDSTEKVFIQFSEDYCYSNDDLFFLAYGEFKNFIPDGFPWGYKYDMNYINTQKGINIIIKEKYFKLKTLLQLLEYGLNNKDFVIEKENVSKGKRGRYVHRVINGQNWMKYELYNEPESPCTIDSIFQNDLSSLAKKYLSQKVNFNDPPKVLTQKNVELFLQNDSIIFVDAMGTEILKLSTINSISYENTTDCLFILNSNHSFYFFNQKLKSNQKRYDFTFELRCIDRLTITYLVEDSKYKLRKGGSTIIVIDEKGNEINADWVYFDETNGVTRKE